MASTMAHIRVHCKKRRLSSKRMQLQSSYPQNTNRYAPPSIPIVMALDAPNLITEIIKFNRIAS